MKTKFDFLVRDGLRHGRLLSKLTSGHERLPDLADLPIPTLGLSHSESTLVEWVTRIGSGRISSPVLLSRSRFEAEGNSGQVEGQRPDDLWTAFIDYCVKLGSGRRAGRIFAGVAYTRPFAVRVIVLRGWTTRDCIELSEVTPIRWRMLQIAERLRLLG